MAQRAAAVVLERIRAADREGFKAPLAGVPPSTPQPVAGAAHA